VDSDFLKPFGMVTGYRRVPADDHLERKTKLVLKHSSI
jgi:hypothetical protein